MEEVTTDILIIGSGLAGAVAALEAARFGFKILLVSKVAIGIGTNSALAHGAFSTAGPCFPVEQHIGLTIEVGKGLNHVSLVKLMAEESQSAMKGLEDFGVSFVRTGMTSVVDRPLEVPQIPGVILMRKLREALSKREIIFAQGFTIFDIINEDGEAKGAIGFSKDGKPIVISSKATILAAGGAGAIYSRHDNQQTIIGDGYLLALKCGLSVLDLEFVQFYPFGFAEPGLSTFILYPWYPPEVKLINARGENLLTKFKIESELNHAIITQRDLLSILIYKEDQEGGVYFDLTEVPEERWVLYPLNLLAKTRFDFRKRPVRIAPVAHFFMGGVEINERAETQIRGLFAAGEVTSGIHGANRLGGNALTECIVFGKIAGRSAAEYARSTGNLKIDKGNLRERVENYICSRAGSSEVDPRQILSSLRELAWRFIGPIRKEDSLKEGLEQLERLEKKSQNALYQGSKGLLQRNKVENLNLLIKAILKGSLLRKESRGSFCRCDFPYQDDKNWLKNTYFRLYETERDFVITHRPVKN
jgi:succinate dehydrogenase/fumarate reductase flavoprotein subunit